VNGVRIDDRADCDEVLAKALSSGETWLIEVPIEESHYAAYQSVP